jgi:hypothetical protein
MKTKCPHCNNGCEKCVDGFREGTIATGDVFQKICKKCFFINGISFHGNPNTISNCVHCGSETEWIKT